MDYRSLFSLEYLALKINSLKYEISELPVMYLISRRNRQAILRVIDAKNPNSYHEHRLSSKTGRKYNAQYELKTVKTIELNEYMAI